VAAVSREGQLVHFERQHLCSCCHDREVLSGEMRRDGDQDSRYSAYLAPTDFFLFPALKEEDFKTLSISRGT
jgi:hypothetical protein